MLRDWPARRTRTDMNRDLSPGGAVVRVWLEGPSRPL